MSVPSRKILIVVTSHGVLGATGKPTGYYLSEVSHPYAALAERGWGIDIASPRGGEAPLDPSSLNLDDPVNKAFWENPATRALLTDTKPLARLSADAYAAILFAGGHGTVWDFPADPDAIRLAQDIHARGGVVASVCHGAAALVNLKAADGRPLVEGKHVTAFSNAEEEAVNLASVVPFALETALAERGARYENAPLWQACVVVDDRLVTGQNPASARGVGEELARVLESARRA